MIMGNEFQGLEEAAYMHVSSNLRDHYNKSFTCGRALKFVNATINGISLSFTDLGI